MNFSIGKTHYFQSIGFNPKYWRKSLDGEYALVHYDLIKEVANERWLTIYQHDSEEFTDLMNGPEWTEEEEEVPE